MALPECELTAWSVPGVRFRLQIDPNEMYGMVGAFGPILTIQYKITEPESPHLQDPVLVSLGGALIADGSHGAMAGLPIAQQPVVVNQPYLRLSLSPAHLHGLENLRAGGDMTLYLDMTGVATVPPRSDIAASEPVTRPVSCQNAARLTVPREHWLRILKAIGGDDFRLIEVPAVQLPAAVPIWAASIGLLQKAAEKHRRGDYEECIQDCRRVVEGTIAVLGEQWREPRASGEGTEKWTKRIGGRIHDRWSEDRPAGDVLLALVASLWTWTSPTHHYPSRVPLRGEAALALGLTSNLLELGGRLLTAHPEPLKREASPTPDASPAASAPTLPAAPSEADA